MVAESGKSRDLLLYIVEQFLIRVELQGLYSNLHFYLRFLPLGGR